MTVNSINGKFNSTDVERYGKLLVDLSTEYERYQVYGYKGRFIEIEKNLGVITSMTVNHSAPKYLTTLIKNEVKKVF